jgi:hypothetical protein
MPQIITDIYTKYKIPPNLQRHQLEVTAVGRYICDHWSGDAVDRDKITQALLLHDMGNILKFKRPFLGELEPQAAYWESVQEEFKTKYGDDVHTATDAIVTEVTTDPDVRACVHALDSNYLTEHGYPNLEIKICNYADMCVAPEGIVGFEARMQDLKERYGLSDEKVHLLRRRINAAEIEKYVSVDLSKLSEVDFSQEIELLKLYSI